MASEPTLLPCPFCGGAAHIERYGTARASTIYMCDYCGCSLETGEVFNIGGQWNRRHALDAAAAVDGDAQWNAAIEACINFPLMLEIQSPKTGPFTREDRVLKQYRAAIRSLKRG